MANFIILSVLVIHMLRKVFLLKESRRKNHEDFDGDLYQVGRSIVAHVKNTGPHKKTIICMHGWLEDYRYFTQLYNSNDGELILINSCDYHAANKEIEPINATWQTDNPYDLHTIEYDAAVLIQAVTQLAGTDELLLHGHSRGGAVILEAIKQAPALFKNAKVILEAPILPEAPIVKANKLPKIMNDIISYVVMYPFPFIVALLAGIGTPSFTLKNIQPMNARKKHLMLGMLNNPKSPKVLINNLKNMKVWPLENKVDLFDEIKEGYILIGSKDAVLSRSLMLKVANKSKDNITVVESKDSSHFLTLDIPDQVKSLEFK